MSNTNQNFEDSGGFGQDEAESEDHENDLYDQPLENVEIEDRSQYLNIPLNSIGNLPMNDILKNPFKVKKTFKSYNKIRMNLYIDTEFENDLSLSFQVRGNYYIDEFETLSGQFRFMVIDSFFKDLIFEKTKLYSKENNLPIFFEDLTNNKINNFLFIHITRILIERKQLEKGSDYYFDTDYYLFFSHRDLYIPLGIDNITPLFNKHNSAIKQNNCLTGQFILEERIHSANYAFKITLRDLKGFAPGSLKDFLSSYAINTKNKTLLDDYKAHMSVALVEKTEIFIDYSMFDVDGLEEVSHRFINSFSDIVEKCFNLENPHYTYKQIPATMGSLVFKVFSLYQHKKFHLQTDYFSIMLAKESILNTRSNNYNLNIELFSIIKKFKSTSDIDNFESLNHEKYMQILDFVNEKKNFAIKPWEYTSTKYLINQFTNENHKLLIPITGGRASNERPLENVIREGADVDISSAYGNSMLDKGLPYGRPHTYHQNPNDTTPITLGKFFKKQGNNLSDYFKIIVSGKLSFNQDIILSRIDQPNIKFDLLNPDYNITRGQTCILRQEIVNGTITRELYELIQKVSSKKELAEFNNLVIKASIFYLQEDFCETKEIYLNKSLADRGDIVFSQKSNQVEDQRGHHWMLLPFDSFIGELVRFRKLCKNTPGMEGMSTAVKYNVNTYYGLTCSVWFSTNSTMVGDRITSKVRVQAWLLAKSLNAIQIITDGGGVCFNTVFQIKKHLKSTPKPSINALSSVYSLEKHRSIEKVSLGGINWVDYCKNLTKSNYDPNYINNLLDTHVENFWKTYNIKIDFKLEIKNIFKKASYLMKSHYMFFMWNTQTSSWEYYHKIRGFKYDVEEKFPHPIYLLLRYLCVNMDEKDFLTKPWLTPNNRNYNTQKMVQLKSYKIAMFKHKPTALPGYTFKKEAKFRLNNLFIHFNNQEEFKSCLRRNEASNPYLFEKYLNPFGIGKTFELMNTNNLSVHVPDDDIYYRNKKKKKLTKKQLKVWNDFWTHMNYLIFYCFQLEQLVDLDMAINPSIKFSSYFKKPKLESFQKSKKFKLSLSSKLFINKKF